LARLCVAAFRPGKEKGKEKDSHFCLAGACCGHVLALLPVLTNRAAKRWENFMLGRSFHIAGPLIAALLLSMPLARAQSAAPAPSPETLIVARELVTTIHFVEQFKAVIPTILKSLKPAVVQGRSNVERDYDVMVPVLLDGFQARFDELSEAAAIIYASNFSTEDLRGLIAFYKTPVGQKFLQKASVVAQQSMLAGQKFGQSVAADLQRRMIEELRKKGHDL
jgi:hypothetical protein